MAEKKVIKSFPHGRKRITFVENCGGHGMSQYLEQALRACNTELRFFPPNAADLIQLADSFVIQKLKDAWRGRWYRCKIDIILPNGFAATSAKITTPSTTICIWPQQLWGTWMGCVMRTEWGTLERLWSAPGLLAISTGNRRKPSCFQNCKGWFKSTGITSKALPLLMVMMSRNVLIS